MTGALRAQYLERLGVVAYIPRQAAPKPQPKSIVHWEGPQNAAIIFVLQFEGDTLSGSAPELELLRKIMDAARMPQCPVAACFSQTLPIELPTWASQARLITFGGKILKSSRVTPIETLTLGELQYNDAAKRVLWQSLKEIKAVYV